MSKFSSSQFFQICNSPLNRSKTKQLYSFPKEKRFQSTKNLSSNSFYEIPSTKNKRSAGIGYGKKMNITKQNFITPSPNVYNKKSQFDQGLELKKGNTFGLSRESMNQFGPLSCVTSYTPAPNAYVKNSTLTQQSWSMRMKTNSPDSKHSYRFTPGPGAYKTLPALQKDGKYSIARFKSFGRCVFSPPTSDRFEKESKFRVPSPGQYNINTGISEKGNYFLSSLENSRSRTFQKDKRKFFEVKGITPGVGHYRLPSEFGYYDKDKAY